MLWELGWKYAAISKKVKCSVYPVSYFMWKEMACRRRYVTYTNREPHSFWPPSRGRAAWLRSAIRRYVKTPPSCQLVARIKSQLLYAIGAYSFRYLPRCRLQYLCNLPLGMSKEGLYRHRARIGPEHIARVRALRLRPTLKHSYWNYFDWSQALWADETCFLRACYNPA